MFNLTISEAHTFYVGQNGWLVHNQSGIGCLNLKFWNKPIDVLGRRVYQRNDLFEVTDRNLTLMRGGYAPFGYDGKLVVLHHVTQDEPGAMAEVAGRWHEVNTKVLHGFEPNGKSFRLDPVLDKQYREYKSDYWIERAKQLTGGGK